jgi:hypothetical protein
MRERWGTFSVRDHMTDAPFVSEVLLYDRLVIPVPDPADKSPDELEFWKKYGPELLTDCLSILKVKTDKEDGLALAVPWDHVKRERFKNRMSVAAAFATQQRCPEQGYYNDPFEMTRQLIKEEFRPALPPGVSKAWTVAAYTSADAFRQENSAADPDRGRRLAALISHRFLTPTEKDPNHELLKKAIDLAKTPGFHRKREAFYEWQEGIIEENVSDEKAFEEMEKLLGELNEATRKAFSKVAERFLFTMIPIGLGMTGALVAGTKEGIVLAAAGGLVQLARFWRFDRKPVIEAGDLDAAAMIHDAQKALPLD